MAAIPATGPASWQAERAREIIAPYADQAGGLLPCLLALQAEFGWISDEAAAMAAEALNLSRAEVHGALTFYHDLRRAPVGRRVLKLCRAEACQARGGRGVEAKIEAALLDGAPVARISGERLARLLEDLRS